MENKHQQILSEINDLVAALKEQIAALEIKISEYQQIVENHLFDEVLPPVVEAPEEVVDEVVEEDVIDGPEAVEPEADDPEVEELEVEEVEEDDDTPEVVVEMLDAEQEPEEEQPDMFELEVMDIELAPSDDLPFYDDPASADSDADESAEEEGQPAPVAVIDAMTAKQAWRTDMPGTPVKDIRSAISLNDRILFINYLFGEDPIAFQDMLTKLNAMSSFDEAAEYVISANSDWDLESDTVYRFMMAIRRRLQ